jgi:hypothetical protein
MPSPARVNSCPAPRVRANICQPFPRLERQLSSGSTAVLTAPANRWRRHPEAKRGICRVIDAPRQILRPFGLRMTSASELAIGLKGYPSGRPAATSVKRSLRSRTDAASVATCSSLIFQLPEFEALEFACGRLRKVGEEFDPAGAFENRKAGEDEGFQFSC